MQAPAHKSTQGSDHDSGQRGNPLRIAVWGTATFLLLLPLVAMQFTREVNWSPADFLVIGVMLLAACGAYEFAVWMSGNTAYRAGFGIAVVAAFLLVWINLAVGIIGDENNPANLMFGGVLVVGLVSALIARFRPHGMFQALVATASAQMLVAVIALAGDLGYEAVVLSVFFAATWLTSAALFQKAARG
jgi:hypothetical protein